MNHRALVCWLTIATGFAACQQANNNPSTTANVKLMTLDPGHFHAALVQKEMYPVIDSTVYVYAPGGPELEAYLKLINQYNTRPEHPTNWEEKVYTGQDYLQKMLSDKPGNVVVLAGNNRQKTDYISQSVQAGLNVLGDKPMAINSANFTQLQQAFKTAEEKKVLLYDIMTERSEITNMLQRDLVHMPELFGEMETSSAANPSVVMESVHYFYKFVSGNVLRRPTWFFDPTQQGDAIADVGTHLIDLVQWAAYPDQVIDYTKDVEVLNANLWPTPVSKSQFAAITGTDSIPAFLQSMVTNDTIVQTHGNGQVVYRLKNIHARVIARWDYQAQPGSGDTHYALFKGTKANIEIRQGKEENYKPTVYIKPAGKVAADTFSQLVQQAIATLNKTYNGITAVKAGNGWKLEIPDSYKVGHEAHFAQVMQRYLDYLKAGKLPDWEVPGMLAKYYTATRALEIARPGKP